MSARDPKNPIGPRAVPVRRKTVSVRRPVVAAALLAAVLFAAAPLAAQAGPESPEGLIIKEIRLEGLRRTRPAIVRRELISQVGAPYKESDSAAERARLEQLDVFAQIRSEAAIDGNEVVLTYRFVEMFAVLPSLSVQITDENGVAAGVGLRLPNLAGRDISFSGRAMGGGSGLLQFALRNPWFAGHRIGYGLEYSFRKRENRVADFRETAHEALLDIGAPLGGHFQAGGQIEYVNIRSDREGVTLSPDAHDEVTRLGLYLGYDRRDAFIGTHRGWWSEFRVIREFRIFKNASNFTQIDLDIRRYQPLPFGDRHTLTVYGLLTLRTGDVGENVAPWQMFAIGGTNTVRGWEYGARTGKNQLLGTVEYSFTLVKPRLIRLPFKIRYRGGFQACLFGDIGSAWGGREGIDRRGLAAGFGAGLRVLVPVVGMVRLDLAWGRPGSGARFHAGAFEKAVMARRRIR